MATIKNAVCGSYPEVPGEAKPAPRQTNGMIEALDGIKDDVAEVQRTIMVDLNEIERMIAPS